jgi:glycosyltransferase involved in cell wall biosynthesis
MTSTTNLEHDDPLDVTRPIRVASIPSAHVYVRHLGDPTQSAPGVVRLPDPDPDDPHRAAGARWWPPAALDPDWVGENAHRFDVFHVHFGFDAVSPSDLHRLVAELRRHDKPLVYTVHDLRNPHHREPDAHDALLDVLIPAADALITLTPGAAEVILERWGRSALVMPHPHVVDLETMARRRLHSARRRDEFRIGVHVKSLRPSMEPVPVLRVLARLLPELPGAVLQVNGHRDVLHPDGARYDLVLAETLAAWSDAGRVDVRVHDFLSDAELWSYLSSLDVSVLPYRFGTHSGWLEACRDLGTTVLAPSCGFYAQQGDVIGYHHDEGGLDERSLEAAVREAYDAGPRVVPSIDDRRAERVALAARHEELYRSLVG